MPQERENVRKNRESAEKQVRYSTNQAGTPPGELGNFNRDAEGTWQKEFFRLPVRDAEDTARKNAARAGAYRKSAKRSTRR
jgi:hypothetical protein